MGGALTNNGILRKPFGITGVSLDFAALGSLSDLTVSRVDQNHPQATAALQTGKYWSFKPNAGAAGFNAGLTLPAGFVPDAKDKVCRYTSSGNVWDCDMTGFSAALQTITRAGVTAFSDWAVGDNAGPTNLGLSRFAALGQGGLPITGLFGALILLSLLAALLRWQGRGRLAR